jgi:tetratricopeptide (TPR) repeat protein
MRGHPLDQARVETRARFIHGELPARLDSEKAMRAFQKGLELAPGYADLHNDLGVAHLKLERCRDAAASFERALECNRYYQAALLNLAIALALNVVLKQDYDLARPAHCIRRLLEPTCSSNRRSTAKISRPRWPPSIPEPSTARMKN